jgi:hypothetical protein
MLRRIDVLLIEKEINKHLHLFSTEVQDISITWALFFRLDSGYKSKITGYKKRTVVELPNGATTGQGSRITENLFITGAINVGSVFFRFEKECAALNASLLKRSIKCRNAKLSLALFRSIRSFGDKEIKVKYYYGMF